MLTGPALSVRTVLTVRPGVAPHGLVGETCDTNVGMFADSCMLGLIALHVGIVCEEETSRRRLSTRRGRRV